MVNVQRRDLPVVEDRERFNLPGKEIEPSDQMIVVRTSTWVLVLVVDGVRGGIDCPDDDLIKKETILLESLPRYVRGLACVREKEIDLVSNCVDRVIGKPGDRKKKEKPPRGTITLTGAPRGGGKVEVAAADDGAGIDIATVRSAAHKFGVVERNGGEGLSEKDLLTSVFRSGVSAGPILPAISGRGFGLAIVQEKVAKVGGAAFLTRIRRVLELPCASGVRSAVGVQAAVLTPAAQMTTFAAGEVASEQEVLLTELGRTLARVRSVAGVTVIWSGQVVPRLNAADLRKSALTPFGSAGIVPEQDAAVEERKPILVVEDSISSRPFLQNILQSSGSGVTTAADGVDGFAKPHGGTFQVVVSETDRPRLNGFDLTANVRADKKRAELPGILVAVRCALSPTEIPETQVTLMKGREARTAPWRFTVGGTNHEPRRQSRSRRTSRGGQPDPGRGTQIPS